jgi:hypothetical protein
MKSSAEFSPCRKYRFTLWRTWDETKPYAMFIGLNPSTADETQNDPTVTRCINYAKSWGYGGLCMTNIFAYRATQPEDMMSEKKPIGDENDASILNSAKEAGVVVAAWGNDGSYMGRSKQVKKLVQNLHCINMNASGEPTHPLYQKADLKPILMDI